MVRTAELDISKYRLPPATRPWKNQEWICARYSMIQSWLSSLVKDNAEYGAVPPDDDEKFFATPMEQAASYIPPSISPHRHTRSTFAGNLYHYDRWVHLFLTSTCTELSGSVHRRYHTVSESGKRYRQPFSAGDVDQRRFGKVWSDQSKFFAMMPRAVEKILSDRSSPAIPARLHLKPETAAPPGLVMDERLEIWLSDLAENNAKCDAASLADSVDSGYGEPPGSPPPP